DALRKSDQQRQRSVTPTLMSAQVPAAGARQPALFWYGLLAAALLGAGILIGWLQQGQVEPAPPVIQASAHRPPETSVQQFAPPPSPPAAVPETIRKPEIKQAQREPVAAVSSSVSNIVPAAQAPAVAATQAETSAKPPVLPSPAAAAPVPPMAPKHEEASDAARNPVVMTMAELPPLIQQELPKLAVLAHSYSSKPKARFVFINDRMVHEEESPAPGLKLEQITPDGMIFSYKGYRFRRAANQ
ncbi:MAG: general secretion pathway protein GspB, partial [Proteobacteria bacterium]|nr:general secretion pathway protein GspB [Pseudomonadota bacterium]